MKRRVLLARALVTNPDVLLLDEPTNHLDVEVICWLEEFLSRLRATLIFVTHDRRFLQTLATRILEIDRGRLFDWSCDYETFLARKADALAAEEKQNALFDKRLAEEEVWIRQGVKARRTRNEGRVRAAPNNLRPRPCTPALKVRRSKVRTPRSKRDSAAGCSLPRPTRLATPTAKRKSFATFRPPSCVPTRSVSWAPTAWARRRSCACCSAKHHATVRHGAFGELTCKLPTLNQLRRATSRRPLGAEECGRRLRIPCKSTASRGMSLVTCKSFLFSPERGPDCGPLPLSGGERSPC